MCLFPHFEFAKIAHDIAISYQQSAISLDKFPHLKADPQTLSTFFYGLSADGRELTATCSPAVSFQLSAFQNHSCLRADRCRLSAVSFAATGS